MLLGSLTRGLQRAGIFYRVLQHKQAAEGVSFERLVEYIENIEVPSTIGLGIADVCDSCRLVHLLDPIIVGAQNCLEIDIEALGWTRVRE
jgi:hypothetical protein